MKQHVLYLRVEGYLRQWLIHKYGDEPIAFPKWSKENDFLKENLRRKPEYWKPEKVEGSIAFLVPKLEGFKRNVWCYVPPYKLTILKKMLQRQFERAFFEFLATPNTATPTFKLRIIDFMDRNGIDDEGSALDTLLKIRQRKGQYYDQPLDIDAKANKSHKGVPKKNKRSG